MFLHCWSHRGLLRCKSGRDEGLQLRLWQALLLLLLTCTMLSLHAVKPLLQLLATALPQHQQLQQLFSALAWATWMVRAAVVARRLDLLQAPAAVVTHAMSSTRQGGE